MRHVIKAVVVGLALLPNVQGVAVSPACQYNFDAYNAAYATFIGEALEGDAASFAAANPGRSRLGVEWLEALSQAMEDGHAIKGLSLLDVEYAVNIVAANNCNISY